MGFGATVLAIVQHSDPSLNWWQDFLIAVGAFLVATAILAAFRRLRQGAANLVIETGDSPEFRRQEARHPKFRVVEQDPLTRASTLLVRVKNHGRAAARGCAARIVDVRPSDATVFLPIHLEWQGGQAEVTIAGCERDYLVFSRHWSYPATEETIAHSHHEGPVTQWLAHEADAQIQVIWADGGHAEQWVHVDKRLEIERPTITLLESEPVTTQ